VDYTEGNGPHNWSSRDVMNSLGRFAGSLSGGGNGNVNGSGGNRIQLDGPMVDVVWKVVLEKPWARNVRRFLQNNFGILYSCIGRGFYLCLVGGLAFGQGFIIIQLLGCGFVLMGLWTISLKFRYPSLDNAIFMQFDGEGYDMDGADDDGSVLTWTSVPSGGESKRLLGGQR